MSAEHTPATTPRPNDICELCANTYGDHSVRHDRCPTNDGWHKTNVFTPILPYWQSRAVKAEADNHELKKLLAEARSCIFEYPATIDVIEKIDTALSRR